MNEAKAFLLFVAAVADPLYALYQKIKSGEASDPEEEKQLAMNVIRAAKDRVAEEEITKS